MLLSLEALHKHYAIEDPSVVDKIVFEGTRIFTEIKSTNTHVGEVWRRFDKVAPYLYLGKIPTKKSYYSKNHQHELIIEKTQEEACPLGLVVSVINYYELAGYAVVSPGDWHKKNIKQLILPMHDFTADVSNENVIAIIHKMRKCIEKGKSVYVHCKAGRSRSAMISAIYLSLYGAGEELPAHASLVEIEKYLKQKRPQVALDPDKRKKAEEIIQLLQTMPNRQQKLSYKPVSPIPLHSVNNLSDAAIKQFFGSLQIKNAIIHFHSFKKLAIFACRQQGNLFSLPIAENIKTFFKKIYDADNEDWYRNLIQEASPLDKRIEPHYFFSFWSPLPEKTKIKYSELIKDFIEELNTFLTHVFKCSASKLWQIIEKLPRDTATQTVREDLSSPDRSSSRGSNDERNDERDDESETVILSP